MITRRSFVTGLAAPLIIPSDGIARLIWHRPVFDPNIDFSNGDFNAYAWHDAEQQLIVNGDFDDPSAWTRGVPFYDPPGSRLHIFSADGRIK